MGVGGAWWSCGEDVFIALAMRRTEGRLDHEYRCGTCGGRSAAGDDTHTHRCEACVLVCSNQHVWCETPV